jgi:hypothetical protein
MAETERLVPVSWRAPPEMVKDLEAIAAQDQRKISDVIRLLLGPAIRARKLKQRGK